MTIGEVVRILKSQFLAVMGPGSVKCWIERIMAIVLVITGFQ